MKPTQEQLDQMLFFVTDLTDAVAAGPLARNALLDL
jgi:hypothetical protein